MGETVEISKTHYEELKKFHKMFMALLDAGVDNWDGYDIAMRQFKTEDDFDEDE